MNLRKIAWYEICMRLRVVLTVAESFKSVLNHHQYHLEFFFCAKCVRLISRHDNHFTFLEMKFFSSYNNFSFAINNKNKKRQKVRYARLIPVLHQKQKA